MATLTTPDQLLIAMGIGGGGGHKILMENWADQRESARDEYV